MWVVSYMHCDPLSHPLYSNHKVNGYTCWQIKQAMTSAAVEPEKEEKVVLQHYYGRVSFQIGRIAANRFNL